MAWIRLKVKGQHQTQKRSTECDRFVRAEDVEFVDRYIGGDWKVYLRSGAEFTIDPAESERLVEVLRIPPDVMGEPST